MVKKKIVKRKVAAPSVTGGSQGAGIKVTKAGVIRAYLTENPTATFGPAKDELASRFKSAGLTVNPSDQIQFGQIKGKMKVAGGVVDNGKSVSLKQFASLTKNIDPAALTEAIKIISHVGGVEIARMLAKKWADLCESIGEEAARKAVEVIG